ncbi:MAG: DUF1499 domain-containing protein [Pseudomonadota bacterium]
MRWIAIFLLTGLLGACSVGGPTVSSTDPVSVEPPSSPNWALGAPREAQTAALPTHDVPVFATGPSELLAYLDAIALADETVIAVEPEWTSDTPSGAYVQRSALLGFPDVISVKTIDLGAGDAGQRASLIIYSRSVYGYSDLGVNAERLDRWIAELSRRAPVVAGRGTGG